MNYYLESELEYWRNAYSNANQPEDRQKAKAFANALEPLIQELNHLNGVRLSELEDATNSILGLIDDLWRSDDYKYPQDRMERFLSVAGNIINVTYYKLQYPFHLWLTTAGACVIIAFRNRNKTLDISPSWKQQQ